MIHFYLDKSFINQWYRKRSTCKNMNAVSQFSVFLRGKENYQTGCIMYKGLIVLIHPTKIYCAIAQRSWGYGIEV